MNANEYLKQLNKRIYNKEVRDEIMKEYQDHIIDCKEALMQAGMSEAEAEEEAVRQMGDPEEAGMQMNQVYHSLIDWPMIKCMLAFGVIGLIFAVLMSLSSKGETIIPWMFEETVPAYVRHIVGTVLTIYSFLLSVWEKCSDKPTFYSYSTKYWAGGYFINSGFILTIAALIIADTCQGFVIAMLLFCLIQAAIRAFIVSRQDKKANRILMEIGTADTDIYTYKGYGTIAGKKQKVIAKDGEIKKGSCFTVISMKGFRPVVEAL